MYLRQYKSLSKGVNNVLPHYAIHVMKNVHTVNALHDRQVKIMNHWADVAPLQGVDIDDKGEVNVSIAGNSIQYSFVYLLVHKYVKSL